jgi:predicted nucleic acid-binding protein
VDANVLLRHLTGDNVAQSPRSTAYLRRVEQGELRVRVPDTVIFETAYTLDTFYSETRIRIRELLLPIIELPGVVVPGKRRWRRALDLFATSRLSVADAFHVALMEDEGSDTIVSFDKGFDRISGVSRVEP